jgi:hypothetical protein
MNEAEWLTCADPHPMLEHLRAKPSDRKLRLFAVACSRRVWNLIDPLGQSAVDVAEAYADGLTDPDEMRAGRLACQGAGGQASWYAAASKPEVAARNAARSAQAGVAGNPLLGADVGELLAQAGLLRDIFGPLLFRPMRLDLSLLTPTVVQMAQTIYEDRAFDRMPVLADALVEAGCDNDEILDHCQGAGPHVKGCWVVDLLLSKDR